MKGGGRRAEDGGRVRRRPRGLGCSGQALGRSPLTPALSLGRGSQKQFIGRCCTVPGPTAPLPFARKTPPCEPLAPLRRRGKRLGRSRQSSDRAPQKKRISKPFLQCGQHQLFITPARPHNPQSLPKLIIFADPAFLPIFMIDLRTNTSMRCIHEFKKPGNKQGPSVRTGSHGARGSQGSDPGPASAGARGAGAVDR